MLHNNIEYPYVAQDYNGKVYLHAGIPRSIHIPPNGKCSDIPYYELTPAQILCADYCSSSHRYIGETSQLQEPTKRVLKLIPGLPTEYLIEAHFGIKIHLD